MLHHSKSLDSPTPLLLPHQDHSRYKQTITLGHKPLSRAVTEGAGVAYVAEGFVVSLRVFLARGADSAGTMPEVLECRELCKDTAVASCIGIIPALEQ